MDENTPLGPQSAAEDLQILAGQDWQAFPEQLSTANVFWEKKETNIKRKAMENSKGKIFLTILS